MATTAVSQERTEPAIVVGSAVGYLDYKAARGRPSIKTEVMVDELLFRVSGGEPLRQICRDDHMPAFQTVYEWLADDEAFSGRFARAREIGTHATADDCVEISDRGDMRERDRHVRIDTRLKLIEKWNRKDYGQKQDVNHSGTISLEAWVLEAAPPQQIEKARLIDQSPAIEHRPGPIETGTSSESD